MPLLIDFSNPISVCDVYQEGNSHLSPLLLARSSQLSAVSACALQLKDCWFVDRRYQLAVTTVEVE